MVKLIFVGDTPECSVYPYVFKRGEPVEVEDKLADKLIADLGTGNFVTPEKAEKPKKEKKEPEPEEEPIETPEEDEE